MQPSNIPLASRCTPLIFVLLTFFPPCQLLNEIKIHKSLDHANIVHFERFFEDKTNVYILLEVCPSQVLFMII